MNEIDLDRLRTSQSSWQAMPIAGRIKVLRALRYEITARAQEFMQAVQLPGRRIPVETLPLEVLPLLDAIRYLERNAARLLKPARLGRAGRPLWLAGVEAEIRRDPCGVILIIAPFNYPLFLPGVQAVQALAAGNAVLIKPSPGHSAPMRLLGECLSHAGLPANLFTVLDETVAAAEQAIEAGVDKIILTGSATAGRAVLERAARHITPCIIELSGNDAVFVLPGADSALVVRALAYGLRLNGGATCIAPRRVYLPQETLATVEARLVDMLPTMSPARITPSTRLQMERLLAEAGARGCRIYGGHIDGDTTTPCVVVDSHAASGLALEDIFAPVLSLIPVSTPEQALKLASQSPYRLGASVFGPTGAAAAFARRVDAGAVVVNDLIVPTADPRLPFEGRGMSGFGPTRGEEGFLAMTKAHTLSIRKNRFYPHFREPEARDSDFFLPVIALLYGKPSLGQYALRLVALWKNSRASRRG